MRVQELTKSAFEKYGRFISADDKTNIFENDDIFYVGNIAVLDMNGALSASILEPKSRDLVVPCLECHKKTAEICIALKQDSVFCVALDQNGSPDPESLEAFYLKGGDTVVYNANVWHWLPYPVNAETCKLLIIYQDQTGQNDFFLEHLPSPVSLEI